MNVGKRSPTSGVVVLWILAVSTPCGSHPTLEHQQSKRTVPAGQAVVIKNLYGDVRARSGEGSTLEAYAVIQNLDPATPAPAMSIEQKEGATVVEVNLAESPPSKPDRADLVVYVPPGSPVRIITKNGLAEVKGFEGDVTVETTSGQISLRGVGGQLQARSDNGNIMAEVKSSPAVHKHEFITTTGNIELWLWEDLQAGIRVETSGQITTDYSIEIIRNEDSEPDKLGKAVLGKGGTAIHAVSKRGNILLLRMIKQFKKAEPST